MIKAAIASEEEPLPPRFVFDEGHHLFEAADSAFCSHLTARETSELRRWLLGDERKLGKRSRLRGLRKRLEDLITGDEQAESLLVDILHAAHMLPGPGWSQRLKQETPSGVTEEFLTLVHTQVKVRTQNPNSSYSIETPTFPAIEPLKPAAKKLASRLSNLCSPMLSMTKLLRKKLDLQADTMNSETRKRLESVCSGLERRAENTIKGWIAMLETLEQEQTPETFVDWMEIEKIDGHAYDLGMYRHWVDPMQPFAVSLAPYVQGALITSATLKDSSKQEESDWQAALTRTGAQYLTHDVKTVSYPSPFDYESQARIFIVNDINKNDLEQVSSAYRELFLAAGGGALGLFTAIHRLKAVHNKIISPLEENELHLFAQHIDEIDTATLVDIFRDDKKACLLGTDALRDGVDVPGKALKLLVYDRVPWPRPTILHKARKEEFGGRLYDERITRFKIRQAFGRLIRTQNDKGVFVILDSGMPTRLCSAFPRQAVISRTGLSETINEIRAFIGSET
jgi:ATP-dependent DNA helicase DinG